LFFLLKAEAKRKKQVVTELEREQVMNGNLADLMEHQKRIDEERDAQVRIRGWMSIRRDVDVH
jgi:hypothetical protein